MKPKSKKTTRKQKTTAAIERSRYATAMRFFGRAPKAQARNNAIKIGAGSSSMVAAPPAAAVVDPGA